jgi:hypothetical protein
LYCQTFFFAPPTESDSDAIGVTGAQSLELEAPNIGDGADSSSLLISETQMKKQDGSQDRQTLKAKHKHNSSTQVGQEFGSCAHLGPPDGQ